VTINAPSDETRPVRLVAVGDLLLAAGPPGRRGGPAGRAAGGEAPPGVFAGVAETLAAGDVVFGNLECTLPGCGEVVPTEPRVVAAPELVRQVAAAGFNVVSLANNHMFDCLADGFHRLVDLLDLLGVAHFGAGDDLAAASRPAVVSARGVRLAFLGAADERSGTRPFAGPGRWGVAPLDIDRLAGQVRELAGQVEHVIVSPHWGEERLAIPSPQQIDQARRLIDAGASMVIGHHPHVIQGLEMRQGRPIAYSLGNFVATEVPYADGDVIRWNRTERTGCILTASLTAGGVADVRQSASYDDGQTVRPDDSGFGLRRIAKVNQAVRRGVTLAGYRREHRWVKTFKPILAHLRWSQLKRFRLRQVKKALGLLRGSGKAK
jgi:poly-gamma-glutamate synthesis protein (capsule biosynthesis protein)